jgi:hypothetical protein
MGLTAKQQVVLHPSFCSFDDISHILASLRLAPAAFISASAALLLHFRSALRRSIRRSKANGILRSALRCIRYIKRGAGQAAAAAGKKLKNNRVLPSGTDGAASIQISPSMKG